MAIRRSTLLGAARLLFAAGAVACSVQANRPPPSTPAPSAVAAVPARTPGFRTLQGPTWTFEVPAHWQEVPIGPPAVVSARDTALVGGFLTNVNLVVEAFPGGSWDYLEANLPTLQSATTVVGQRRVSVGPLEAVDLEALWDTGDARYRTVQRFMAGGGRGYVLTCSGAVATFESIRGLCGAVLDTFRLQ